jgi:hypothetical protein
LNFFYFILPFFNEKRKRQSLQQEGTGIGMTKKRLHLNKASRVMSTKRAAAENLAIYDNYLDS